VDKAAPHIGAVAFIHCFDSSLNGHVCFHVCLINGVFQEVLGDHWNSQKRVVANYKYRGSAEF